MLLVKDTDVVRVITSTAADIDSHASFVDYNSATGAIVPNRLNTKIAAAGTNSVVTTPASGVIRNVQDLFVSNVHASNSNQVTIQHYDGTLSVLLESVLLLAGERIAIRDGVPTRLIDANGVEKTNPNALVTAKRLSADLANTTVTAAKVTGLDILMPVGTYIFEYLVIYQNAATTTGIKLSCNHTGTVTQFNYDLMIPTALATAADGNADQDILTATGGLMNVWAARAKSNAATMISAGVDTINVDQMAMITGMATVTVDGNLELWHASEVAASSSTVKANSLVRLTRIP